MSARITQRIILRWGWGVWEGARLDAKRLVHCIIDNVSRCDKVVDAKIEDDSGSA